LIIVWLFILLLSVIFLFSIISKPFIAKAEKEEEARRKEQRASYFAQIHEEEEQRRKQEARRLHQARMEIAESVARDFQRLGWDNWSMSDHLSEEQMLRIKRARSSTRMKLMRCDHSGPCAYVRGDAMEGYRIDKYHCFCPDFDKRYAPCKHMYFLVFKLVGEHPDDDIASTRKTFASMPGWDQWDPDIHKNPDQFARLRLSMVDDGLSVMCYDPKYKLAKVLDRNYANKGKLYLTSCRRCDCEDFQKRKFPCKHMYTLAAALGGDTTRCILDHNHPPLHGVKFTLVGHFPRKSKDYVGVREELASLSGPFGDEFPYYAASAILLGSDPSEDRQAMVAESGLEVLTLEMVREIFSGESAGDS